jgi:hypothetical protein
MMMASEMVELVARATCSSAPCICKHKSGFEGMPCLDRARAAIAAMREPTDAMNEAGAAVHPDDCHGMTFWATVWDAMIDAALEPPKP